VENQPGCGAAAVVGRSSQRDSERFRPDLRERSSAPASDTDAVLAELGRQRAWGQISQHEYDLRRAVAVAPPTLVSRVAEQDLRRLSPDQLDSVRLALASIGAAHSADCDVRPLEERPPWRWIRSGPWRIVYRRSHGDEPAGCWVVARVLDERDLDTAARTM